MEFHQFILNHETFFLRPKSDHPGVIPASISGGLEQLTLHPVIILSRARRALQPGWGENGRGSEHPDIIPRIALEKNKLGRTGLV